MIVQCVSGQHFDNDGNGYANDIAGWNFFDNNNEPADTSSYFAAHHHGTGRALDAVEQGNDGEGSIGVCPHCQVMPMRTWDTFVSDANDFALGIVYATDNGAKVIEGANGSLYHSAFAEAASQYAYDHGVVQTFSGDDLNTGDHNYPANYGHAMLIQGTVPDTVGLGEESSQWVRRRRNSAAPPASRRASARTFPSARSSAAPTRRSTAARARSRWRDRPARSTRARPPAPPGSSSAPASTTGSRCDPTRRASCSSRRPSGC